jgi:hypothetical protein
MGSRNLENSTPPIRLAHTSNIGGKPHPLTDIRVLELCIIMAGSTIGRIPAEYGADVIKVTTSSVSDVPFFQVDGNKGKPTLVLKHVLAKVVANSNRSFRPSTSSLMATGPARLRSLDMVRSESVRLLVHGTKE